MPTESGYTCLACSSHFDDWSLAETHIASNPTHAFREAFADPASRTLWPAPASAYSHVLEMLVTRRGVQVADALANLSQTIYSDAASIPAGNAGFDQWAMVFAPGPNDGLFQLAFSLAGETTWTATDWPYTPPPSPLGSWVVNGDDNSIGAGSAGWQYYMGSDFKVLAAGNGLQIKRIAFKNSAVATHNWEIRKSTVVGAGDPAVATYTTVVDSGTFTSVANQWVPIVLGTPITVATNESYCVWYWIGTGGQSQNSTTLTPAQLDETFLDLRGGLYRSVAGTAPGPASSPPQTRQATTIYGIATAGIG